MVEPAGIVIKARKRSWKESEHEVFQETTAALWFQSNQSAAVDQ